MKVRKSITLSEDLIRLIEKHCLPRQKDLSTFIEEASWSFISKSMHSEQEEKDLEIINKRAEYLNKEAADVLDYQVEL